ncbi:MAG TPA: hypothetical protein PLN06_05555 [Bacteroidales bacterium]|nr:hypothetical protein [Bacteroidales bacterium]HQG36962.1 hypothetical protein [Bacteroidales bacterium]HQG52198.1 hypothetical protein [Bacteroidales bacterium]HQJ19984.1 hypothetical protein [Bacteroidales bacterium]
MKKILYLLFIFGPAIAFLQSCEKKDNPPTIPPVETMLIDFTNFTNDTKSATVPDVVNNSKAVINYNWSLAATFAGVWNKLFYDNFIVPVEAFRKAAENKSSYLDNKKWQWKYSVNVLSVTYIARFTGQITSKDIKWEMYISRSGVGGFDEFMWFNGTTSLDGKSGQWIMYESKDSQVPMLQIDWVKTGTEVESVKYTYIKDGNLKNSYIEYNRKTSSYKIYLYDESRGTFVSLTIEWSATGRNGRIQASDYFDDSNWHCWDGNKNDIQCP